VKVRGNILGQNIIVKLVKVEDIVPQGWSSTVGISPMIKKKVLSPP
jgi:hypothetical protein